MRLFYLFKCNPVTAPLADPFCWPFMHWIEAIHWRKSSPHSSVFSVTLLSCGHSLHHNYFTHASPVCVLCIPTCPFALRFWFWSTHILNYRSFFTLCWTVPATIAAVITILAVILVAPATVAALAAFVIALAVITATFLAVDVGLIFDCYVCRRLASSSQPSPPSPPSSLPPSSSPLSPSSS